LAAYTRLATGMKSGTSAGSGLLVNPNPFQGAAEEG
jgi:hypothetical protein